MKSQKEWPQALIHKNLHRTILSLSLPGMISSVLQTLFQLIDAYWVGKLGAGALAAIGGCSFILWAVYSLTALSSNGISTLVAQNMGAGKMEQGRYTAGQGMLLSTVSAVVLSLLVLLLQQPLYTIMGFSETVRSLAFNYMTIIAVALIFSFWFTGLEAVFRGLGDTRTPMYILAVALTLNGVLDPVFIFGWLGFPAMGISGAALATVLAQLLAALLCGALLKRQGFVPTLKKESQTVIGYPTIRRILDIGSPIALGGFFFSLIYVILTNIISRFGTEAIAAIGVCHRIEGIAWFACVGFSVAASTLVGQNVGAGRIRQAERAGWWVNGYGVATLFVVSVIFFVFPQQLMQIFTNDVLVRQYGVEYLRIVAVFEIFLALEVIMEGAFSGAGYTLPVMLVSVPVTAARIPLAWILGITFGWGVQGIWWAIALTTFIKGFLNTVLFALGIWKKHVDLATETDTY